MKKTRMVAALGAATLLMTGCSLGDQQPATEVSSGSLGAADTLEGLSVAVGGKEFTEQLVLCELTAQALQSVGAEVERKCGMSGSSTVRSALTSDQIDLYWEYTGTGWITHLGETEPLADPAELYQAVAERDQAENQITWLDPSPANNTYAIATNRENAEKLGVTTISEYAALAKKDPAAASYCAAAEFLARDDGWPGVQEAYGFELPSKNRSEVAAGVVYDSVAKGDPCAFGTVFATDGRIAALDLVQLEDDQQFFTPYNPAVTVRDEVLAEKPELREVLKPIAEALDDATLQSLNGKVDADGETPEQVATDWLTEKGFVAAG
ncbi:glycine betaine ABC transporter substrate-binding protein [Kineosporia babensis]|uniref:Glycine betaine ABC transporter substrate-binding protein n=1 Tax=Kineosporia babensis TaxID=499548 RepID=A0A9X1NDZ2_9ACTN|nr:glycine betaine ABC transporter substrate-binding protein [Kineosporia babensis]MCD5311313.1 glycine betaine ABC transporter substrate-binding protein [Kineosporia babensis]